MILFALFGDLFGSASTSWDVPASTQLGSGLPAAAADRRPCGGPRRRAAAADSRKLRGRPARGAAGQRQGTGHRRVRRDGRGPAAGAGHHHERHRLRRRLVRRSPRGPAIAMPTARTCGRLRRRRSRRAARPGSAPIDRAAAGRCATIGAACPGHRAQSAYRGGLTVTGLPAASAATAAAAWPAGRGGARRSVRVPAAYRGRRLRAWHGRHAVGLRRHRCHGCPAGTRVPAAPVRAARRSRRAWRASRGSQGRMTDMTEAPAGPSRPGFGERKKARTSRCHQAARTAPVPRAGLLGDDRRADRGGRSRSSRRRSSVILRRRKTSSCRTTWIPSRSGRWRHSRPRSARSPRCARLPRR